MRIEEVKQKVIEELGSDSFADPTSWDLIENKIPEEHWHYLFDRDGASEFAAKLPDIFPAEYIGMDQDAQVCWERIGNFFKNRGRVHEALSIYRGLYDQLLLSQEKTTRRLHKGAPLVWMSDCYAAMNFAVLAKRYLMLALCEDAISASGVVSPHTTGVYFRLVWGSGLAHANLIEYGVRIFELWKANPLECAYPEWLLQELDQDWMTEMPAPREAVVYSVNTRYVKHLLSQLGEPTGKILECLAEYSLSCMPGCRTKRRERSGSTDYDVVCSMEGFEVDFRSELGRYFVCECKDWKSPADFGSFAKFCRVLDSTKSRFGVLYSKQGITGDGRTRDAEREQLKVFQDRGIVIVVVDENDLEFVANGGNFINLLRTKYERVRLDLTHSSQ